MGGIYNLPRRSNKEVPDRLELPAIKWLTGLIENLAINGITCLIKKWITVPYREQAKTWRQTIVLFEKTSRGETVEDYVDNTNTKWMEYTYKYPPGCFFSIDLRGTLF